MKILGLVLEDPLYLYFLELAAIAADIGLPNLPLDCQIMFSQWNLKETFVKIKTKVV